MGSMIRATNLWGYVDLVRELGGDPDHLLSRFHITPGVEHREDAFLPIDGFVHLLEVTAEELECLDFGLRLSEWQGLDILGPIAVIARNAGTVEEGLASVARYLYVHSPALHLTVAPPMGGAHRRFTYEVTELTLSHLKQGYELSMANAARIVRLLGGSDATPCSVSFLHERMGSEAAYQRALGCPVRFGQQWCGFELPLTLSTRRIDSAHPETRRIATMYLESQYLPSNATLTDRVASVARRLIPTGHCTVEAIADQMAMHPRTLQRRIADEGLRCQDVIERERRDQAAKYLAEPDLHLSQITGLLGYTEQSTLTRSCRRWFAKTPRQYRADLAGQPGPRS
jgi:AraC-like DNA-binding protein